MALRFLSARSPDLLGQPAAHMMRRARFLARHAPTTVEQHVPWPSRRRRAAHDSRPADAPKEPEQYPLTQAVDFSQGVIEPDNLLTRGSFSVLRSGKDGYNGSYGSIAITWDKKAYNSAILSPVPGTQSASGNLSRMSQLSDEASGHPPNLRSPQASKFDSGRGFLRRQHNGVRRPTRARDDTHARHDERPNRHEMAS